MTWLRMTDKAHHDPRVVSAGNAAWGAFTRCADWAADLLTDGFVPLDLARSIAAEPGMSNAKITAVLARVTAAGLWIPVTEPAAGFVIDGWLEPDGIVGCRSRDDVLAERRKATERQRRHREVTAVSRRDSTVSHGPPDQTRPDLSAVHDQTTTTTQYAPPSSTSSSSPSTDLHGIDPDVLDACLLLMAEAVTVARNPTRPRGFRHQVLTNLRAERTSEIAARIAAGATAYDLAAHEAGGECWARQALLNLQRPINPIELVQ